MKRLEAKTQKVGVYDFRIIVLCGSANAVYTKHFDDEDI